MKKTEESRTYPHRCDSQKNINRIPQSNQDKQSITFPLVAQRSVLPVVAFPVQGRAQ